MGLRKTIIDRVFKGNKNIWTNVLVSGSNAPAASVTGPVGTMMICGTGASPTVWMKVCASSTGITLGATGVPSSIGTWVRIQY